MREPVEDISALPGDWLDAFVTLVSEDEDPGDGPGDRFLREITAIWRMREIELRDGRGYHAGARNARREWRRRRGMPMPIKHGQLYDTSGGRFEVTAVSPANQWVNLRRIGARHGKRYRLPLPEHYTLAGWTA